MRPALLLRWSAAARLPAARGSLAEAGGGRRPTGRRASWRLKIACAGRSLHVIFGRQKAERDARVASLEEQLAARDAALRAADARAWAAEEAQREAEHKLEEAARRAHVGREETRKVYENEQMRLEYVQAFPRSPCAHRRAAAALQLIDSPAISLYPAHF